MPDAPARPPRPAWRRRLGRALVAGITLYLGAHLVAWARVWLDDEVESVVRGTDQDGAIEHAHPLPPFGVGFTTYAIVGSAMGRQYVHRRVRDALIDAFRQLAIEAPERVFVVAETGDPSGGSFWPHHSHERGLSVDVLVPMRSSSGARTSPPSWPWDGFGYRHELDATGRLGSDVLDATDLARLLCTLARVAPDHGVRVRRIILAPELQPAVEDAADCHLGRRWIEGTPWVRHDEHVHLDFDVE